MKGYILVTCQIDVAGYRFITGSNPYMARHLIYINRLMLVCQRRNVNPGYMPLSLTSGHAANESSDAILKPYASIWVIEICFD